MFIQTPTAGPPLGGTLSNPSINSPSQPFDPLRNDAYTTRSATVSPLHSPGPSRQGGAGPASSGFDPLGQIKTHQMSSSVRIQTRKPKLDPREAASKLANMF